MSLFNLSCSQQKSNQQEKVERRQVIRIHYTRRILVQCADVKEVSYHGCSGAISLTTTL